jgi:hypothetical protein
MMNRRRAIAVVKGNYDVAPYNFLTLCDTETINYGLSATGGCIPEIVYCRLRPARNRMNCRYVNNLSEVSCTATEEDSGYGARWWSSREGKSEGSVFRLPHIACSVNAAVEQLLTGYAY